MIEDKGNLVSCRHCGWQVSDNAKTCPRCGCINPQPSIIYAYFFATVVIAIFLVWLSCS